MTTGIPNGSDEYDANINLDDKEVATACTPGRHIVFQPNPQNDESIAVRSAAWPSWLPLVRDNGHKEASSS